MQLTALAGSGLNALFGRPLKVCELGNDEIGWFEFEYRSGLDVALGAEALMKEYNLPPGGIQAKNHRFYPDEESGEILVFHGMAEKSIDAIPKQE